MGTGEISQQRAQPEFAALVEAVRRGDYDFAIRGLKGFIEVHPGHEVATGLLAASYFQIGMPDRASELYRELLAVYPTNALARFQLGLIYLNSNPHEALNLWRPLLAAEHEFMAHFHSALAHWQLDERDAARPLLEHAAKYMPESHPLRAQLNQMRSSLMRNEPYSATPPSSSPPSSRRRQ